MTVSRDNDTKPRVASNNFSVLMADADDDEGGSSGHSSVKTSPSFPSLSTTAGASKKEQTSFATASFSQVATNDTSNWQTFRKPPTAPSASAPGPSKPPGLAGGDGDGMYRGSSSTLMNRYRPAPSSSGQQASRQYNTNYRRQPSGSERHCR